MYIILLFEEVGVFLLHCGWIIVDFADLVHEVRF